MKKNENAAADDLKLTPQRWAATQSPEHAKAMRLLTGEEVATIRRGLAARDRIKALEDEVDAMNMIGQKLDRLVNVAGGSDSVSDE